MKPKTNTPLIVALVVVAVLFLYFGSGAMSGGMMNSGTHEGGWMDERGWTSAPALLTLGLGVVLGWAIFRKRE